MTERPKRWEKGVFHKGEFKEYLKVMTDAEAETLFCLKENKERGNPMFVTIIAISSVIDKDLRKNQRKTIKIPVIAKKYRIERNKIIRKKITEILKVGFLGEKEKEEKVQSISKSNLDEMSYDELRNIVKQILDEGYGKDLKHLHRRNLDESKDLTND